MSEAKNPQRIGPAPDLNSDTSHIEGEGYREDRGLEDIEAEMRERKFQFSFPEFLRGLAASFPTAPVLRIVEGGCGEAKILERLRSIAQQSGIPVQTIGVTNAERNRLSAQQNADQSIIDSVEDAFAQRELQPPTHAVFDFYGAMWHDSRNLPDGKVGHGVGVIPVYSQLLVPHGKLVFGHAPFFDEKFDEYWGSEARDRMVQFLEENNLSIQQWKGGYVLAEKNG